MDPLGAAFTFAFFAAFFFLAVDLAVLAHQPNSRLVIHHTAAAAAMLFPAADGLRLGRGLLLLAHELGALGHAGKQTNKQTK